MQVVRGIPSCSEPPTLYKPPQLQEELHKPVESLSDIHSEEVGKSSIREISFSLV